MPWPISAGLCCAAEYAGDAMAVEVMETANEKPRIRRLFSKSAAR